MSATLNFNQTKYYSWKGQTLHQITSSIQKNNDPTPNLNTHQLLNPLPLKIYRKEILIKNPDLNKPNCNPRISVKIDDINMPGGTTVSARNAYADGLDNTLDINLTQTQYERPNSCLSCFSPQTDARRRVRSSGIIKRKYDENKNNDTYYSSTNQYLVSRNRTFQQNQYNYIRQGDPTTKPGTGLSKTNLYSPAGLSHCKQPMISVANQNNTFQYIWDGSLNTVVIPDGLYDINQLNVEFQRAMTNNKTYLIVKNGLTTDFLLRILYDNVNNQVLLQALPMSNFSSGLYNLPPGSLSWGFTSFTPSFQILSTNNFKNIIGFSPGNYSALSTSSNMKPEILPNYVTLIYKPNNPKFGQQGAVTSGSLTTRIKYDEITTSANRLRSAYGSAVVNALAYGNSEHSYTAKDKVGYPLRQTPFISKYTGVLTCIGRANLG